jgi:hypothetical protein
LIVHAVSPACRIFTLPLPYLERNLSSAQAPHQSKSLGLHNRDTPKAGRPEDVRTGVLSETGRWLSRDKIGRFQPRGKNNHATFGARAFQVHDMLRLYSRPRALQSPTVTGDLFVHDEVHLDCPQENTTTAPRPVRGQGSRFPVASNETS